MSRKKFRNAPGALGCFHPHPLPILCHILLACGAQALHLATRWILDCRSPPLHHQLLLSSILPILSHRGGMQSVLVFFVCLWSVTFVLLHAAQRAMAVAPLLPRQQRWCFKNYSLSPSPSDNLPQNHAVPCRQSGASPHPLFQSRQRKHNKGNITKEPSEDPAKHQGCMGQLPEAVPLYTDGSKLQNQQCGSAWAVFRQGRPLMTSEEAISGQCCIGCRKKPMMQNFTLSKGASSRYLPQTGPHRRSWFAQTTSQPWQC